jgi:16S rRNA processing protein RimM
VSGQYVEIGLITAPHGIKGEARVRQLSEFAGQAAKAARFYVEEQGWLAVDGLRFHKQFMLIKFAGIDSVEAVEKLRNRRIFLTREQIGELPEGRYYIEDLIGLAVLDLSGRTLGTLKEVLHTGSNDVYVVKTADGKDILLPALKTVIKKTDVGGGVMLVDPPVWERD